jgi:hypothetical protein
MFKKLKHGYRQFADDEPGERFLNMHDRWNRRTKSPVVNVLAVIVGLILIAGGFFLGLVPGAPGIVLGLLGFALIAARFRRLAVWLDWAEVKCRKWGQKWRKRFARWRAAS